ncbi:DNA polymerase III subunit beta [Boudabousia liubingyangii]|uniref:Beta sliding clamp n=1 Tax=Boudabousia liubingyangii TaxID=1921764 RepID=A0A1Q5PPH0_9ACTO|nr:DNA polymerase III subunit beta [Boudabousia liubingyangii]OKL48541.1 DNA polymerase III subunit beta [Boudabousia liubingyangii]OKL49423.1 DNA polymerase III subunit beta [Boudabousia liubingyangii]
MKFTINRDVLAEAITWGSRAVPQRPPVPVLAGVRLSAAQGSLVISAFDYETSAKAEVPAEVEQPGEVLVFGKLLLEIAKLLPPKDITFEQVDNKVVIRCDALVYHLSVMNIDEYPTLPEFPQIDGSIDAQELATAVSQVAIAASKDETLPLLTGVKVEIDGANMTFMATDRYRLAMREIMWHPTDPNFKGSTLIRSKVLTEVAKTMTSVGDISLAISEAAVPGQSRIVGFAAGERMTTSNLMDGEYPPVRNLFPDETPIHAVVKRQELIDATRRMRLVAERNTPVRLSFSEGNLELTAGAGEDAQAKESLPAQIFGEDIATAFNPNYLTEGLAVINEPYVRLSFIHPSKPAVLTGQEDPEGEDNRSFRYLLMPIRYGV